MRKPLWLVPALLLAGCRSEQVAVKLSPPSAEPVAATSSVALADTSLTAIISAPRPAEVAIAPTQATAQQPTQLAGRPARPLYSKAAAWRAKLPQPTVQRLLAQRLTRKLSRQRPTEGAAESGLGRVALFFIGIVLAVVAGLAALVNVIFSVGFFTALGYTAAGLVVLALLYLLFSGGGKKKK